jgi:hypothetical protein
MDLQSVVDQMRSEGRYYHQNEPRSERWLAPLAVARLEKPSL